MRFIDVSELVMVVSEVMSMMRNFFKMSLLWVVGL